MKATVLGGLVAAIAALACAGVVGAGVVAEDKPVSLVTRNLVTHDGMPFVRLADLARALGGSGRWDPARARYEIQPGPNGVMLFNGGLLPTLGPGGDPERLKRNLPAAQNAFRISIGGRDVAIDEEDGVMLRPADPAVSLNFLAGLLGGKARFDPGRGSWVLPPGGSGTPLRFR